MIDKVIASLSKELTELTAKIDALVDFSTSDKFLNISSTQRLLLLKQQEAMVVYSSILSQRLVDLTSNGEEGCCDCHTKGFLFICPHGKLTEVGLKGNSEG